MRFVPGRLFAHPPEAGRFGVTLLSLALGLSACREDGEGRATVILTSLDGSVLDAEAAGPPPDAGSCADSTGLEDDDRDGFSRADGDCDDCDPGRGPFAIDVPNNGIDEDCSGMDAVAVKASCDADLDSAKLELDPDIASVVRALGFCGERVSEASHKAGLIGARWLLLSGSSTLHDPRQVWLPPQFGTITPHDGQALVVLSTGVARDRNAVGYTRGCDVFGSKLDQSGSWSRGQPPPKGFPKDSTQCQNMSVSMGALAYDDIGLELTLRAPGNAAGISFDSLFFTYEYPDFVCSRFNDFFVVLMDPVPAGLSAAQKKDGDVAVDDDGNPIGVNTGLLSVCTPTTRSARPIACGEGSTLLTDTGYGEGESSCAPTPQGAAPIGGASTGWLHTEVPVVPGGVFKLRFALWDSGDPLLDSSVALDALRFIARPPVIGTKPTSLTSD